MKTLFRSALALAFLASSRPAPASEVTNDDEGYALMPPNEMPAGAGTTEDVSTAAPGEGEPVQAAQRTEPEGQERDRFESLDRSEDGGG
jgi:hypothetical protein